MDGPVLEVPSSLPNDFKVGVPCGTCHLCCKKTLVLLVPDKGDDPSQYKTQTVNHGGVEMEVLQFQPNGDCIYLDENGCTIHDTAPYMCRIYDCREQHRMYTKAQREDLVKRGMLSKEVLRRGAILIHQQSKGGRAAQGKRLQSVQTVSSNLTPSSK
jgi:Fe-S-cluster containining protein